MMYGKNDPANFNAEGLTPWEWCRRVETASANPLFNFSPLYLLAYTMVKSCCYGPHRLRLKLATDGLKPRTLWAWLYPREEDLVTKATQDALTEAAVRVVLASFPMMFDVTTECDGQSTWTTLAPTQETLECLTRARTPGAETKPD